MSEREQIAKIGSQKYKASEGGATEREIDRLTERHVYAHCLGRLEGKFA